MAPTNTKLIHGETKLASFKPKGNFSGSDSINKARSTPAMSATQRNTTNHFHEENSEPLPDFLKGFLGEQVTKAITGAPHQGLEPLKN
ncbi:hypothetical protein JTB14_014244 [Gonioctena quinquepunctata]|nr:hypothetical protein JTB14_014244 [Gonioctena quinquepunctata]